MSMLSAYKDFLHSYSSPTSARNNWGGQATSDAVPSASAAMDRAREQTGHINAANYQDGKNVGGWSPETQGVQAELDKKRDTIDSTQKNRAEDNERHLRDDLTVPGVARRNLNDPKNNDKGGYGTGGMMSSE